MPMKSHEIKICPSPGILEAKEVTESQEDQRSSRLAYNAAGEMIGRIERHGRYCIVVIFNTHGEGCRRVEVRDEWAARQMLTAKGAVEWA
jgi:YD repeat-containing protein